MKNNLNTKLFFNILDFDKLHFRQISLYLDLFEILTIKEDDEIDLSSPPTSGHM